MFEPDKLPMKTMALLEIPIETRDPTVVPVAYSRSKQKELPIFAGPLKVFPLVVNLAERLPLWPVEDVHEPTHKPLMLPEVLDEVVVVVVVVVVELQLAADKPGYVLPAARPALQ